jgi:hypothetical protein
VVDRVRNEIADELCKSIRIPVPDAAVAHFEREDALRVLRLQLVDSGATDLRQIARYGTDGKATAEAAACEVEKLVDHAQRTGGARRDMHRGLVLDLRKSAPAEHEAGAGSDGAERIVQVVREDADEQLAEILRLLEDVDLGSGVSELRRGLVPLGSRIVPLDLALVALQPRFVALADRSAPATMLATIVHAPVLTPDPCGSLVRQQLRATGRTPARRRPIATAAQCRIAS